MRLPSRATSVEIVRHWLHRDLAEEVEGEAGDLHRHRSGHLLDGVTQQPARRAAVLAVVAPATAGVLGGLEAVAAADVEGVGHEGQDATRPGPGVIGSGAV